MSSVFTASMVVRDCGIFFQLSLNCKFNKNFLRNFVLFMIIRYCCIQWMTSLSGQSTVNSD